MALRNRSTSAASTTPAPAPTGSDGTRPGTGKGRPTPKRKVAEQARRRPLGGVDRKEAAKEQRVKAKAQRDREYQAMLTGDERFLPARDRGPVKRWTRDYIDARRNLGEYFLPVSIIMVFSTLLTQANAAAGLAVLAALYLIVIVTVVDALLLGRRLRKKLTAKFGEGNVPRGSIMYGVLRAFQMRRTRLPKPRVARGQFPD